MPKKPTRKASKSKPDEPNEPSPQRQLLYAGPPGLGDALRELQPQRPALDRSILSKFDHAASTSRVRKSGAGGRPPLLSASMIKQGKAALNELLDKKPHRWSQQGDAAREIAVTLKLPEATWQTVEKRIVVPVFERRGLKKKRRKIKT
jgi:hypothetical protein